MANVTREQSELSRQIIINKSARLFLEKGFTNTTIKNIARAINASTGAITSHFHTKEDILCELVNLMVDHQFASAGEFLNGKTNDKLFLYAAETVLQLHIVESSEHLRDIYTAAYSLPKTSLLIQEAVTGKTKGIFQEYLPEKESKDFYLLEIATGGIMRGFMTVPCNIWFSMDVKVEAFLKTTMTLYSVPPEKIEESIAFVKSIDYDALVKSTIDRLFALLEEQRKALEAIHLDDDD